jgi:hypothetical protein
MDSQSGGCRFPKANLFHHEVSAFQTITASKQDRMLEQTRTLGESVGGGSVAHLTFKVPFRHQRADGFTRDSVSQLMFEHILFPWVS